MQDIWESIHLERLNYKNILTHPNEDIDTNGDMKCHGIGLADGLKFDNLIVIEF